METESYHSFYKILMDLTVKLGLPEGFTEKYHDKGLTNATLKITSGATWDVRVEELEGEGYFFTSGWTKFCRDMELEMLDVLVFSYDDSSSTFHVSVFANTAFEKKSNFRVINNPRFQISLKKYNRQRFCLRIGFAKASGLMNKKKVRLEYPGGRSADVVLRLATRNIRSNTMCLGSGWPGFWKANRLTVDKTYSFEFIPSKNVIQVEPVELEEEFEY